MQTELTIRIAGTAGEGVISAGEILNLALKRAGYYTMLHQTYSAEVRGDGPTMAQVRISASPVLSQGDRADILIAFNRASLESHLPEMNDGGLVIYDGRPLDSFGSSSTYKPLLPSGINGADVPLAQISYKELNSVVSKNLVALGALSSIVSIPTGIMEEIVGRRFGEKGVAALKAGADHASGFSTPDHLRIGEADLSREAVILSGNEAVGVGAIAAGVRYFAGYPITPATNIMEFMVSELPKTGGIVVQTEDEISAICSVLGASFAGEKGMTATSGPGLSLMSETIGLASMAEVPAVIVDVQRGGPSTGMPTKTEQSDLNLAFFGSHGDSPRVVMAPSTVRECASMTFQAFSISESLQVPVIILLDQFLGQRRETVIPPDFSVIQTGKRSVPTEVELKGYKRYHLTEDGVSPMSIPGMKGGEYTATGLEHGEDGTPAYEPETHKKMGEKRWRKLEFVPRIGPAAVRFGFDSPEIGIIGWGSSEGAVREAVSQACDKGFKVAALYPKVLHPLDMAPVNDFVRGLRKVVVVENNLTGQFAHILRSKGVACDSLAVCEGRPLTVGEILKAIEKAL